MMEKSVSTFGRAVLCSLCMANSMSNFFSDLQNWATRSYTNECAEFVSPRTFFAQFLHFFPLLVCLTSGEKWCSTRNGRHTHSYILLTRHGALGKSLIRKLWESVLAGELVGWGGEDRTWWLQGLGSGTSIDTYFHCHHLTLEAWMIQQWVILCKRERGL